MKKYYIITYRGSTSGESGEQCGTDYIFDNACVVCGTGAELKGTLKVRGITKTKKNLFETVNGDCLISKSLKESIVEKLPNLRLEQVVDKKNQSIDFYHLYTRLNLPKFKETSTGYVTEDQCPVCMRNGFYNDVTIGNPTIVKPLAFTYNYEDLVLISNAIILKTWECRGLSNKVKSGNKVVRFARPWIVVREDLKEVLESEKIKNIHFEQIIIEGCVQQNL
ncbi:hypothetical protein [Pontibacter fetidus]|uniref:Uncharacterized protein n=1 Tax=Pontibacter fetidus TaxID=2700082 RepID=A0A6B2H893_9BACT|nr:hypothetical protein [Pontibacter fetidus]NDK55414.1 hypothetical protein [Pontibacter fetidus]